MKRMILCAQANEIDLVDYLQNAGQRPLKIRGNEYWYLSSLREETTPSFKVDRKQNIWYDHGIGKGGNFVDFGILFHNCSVKEFLQILDEKKSLFLSFHQPLLPIENKNNKEHNKIQILSTGPLKN